MQDHTGEGQGHHRGESTTQTLKRAFGWDSTPKMLKSPFFLGLIGSLLVGMMILNDKIEPDVALAVRDRELRQEMYLAAKDRERLAALASRDRHVGSTLDALQQQETQTMTKDNRPL